MIFVNVGTHFQPFDRLIKEVDYLVHRKVIQEDIFIQLGFTIYVPQHCNFAKMISFHEMQNNNNKARIIITHGAPASVVQALRFNKIPIVVPRQYRFREHVTDHQILFTQKMEKKGLAIAIYQIKDLQDAIINYDILCLKLLKNFNKDSVPWNYIQKLEDIYKSF